MFKKLPSHNVPLLLVADVACFVANNNGAIEIGALKQFTNKSEAYIRSCIAICRMLNIICEDGTITPYINELGKTPSKTSRLNVIRKFIQEYEPFITFIQYHLNDESIEEASRKVYSLYHFEGKNDVFLKDIFMTWGITVGVFTKSDDGFLIAESIRNQLVDITPISLSLDDDMAIRIYISNILGGEVFSALSSVEIEELVNGYKKCESDARGAIECVGRSFEDFLRRISMTVGVDVSGKNGIGQVINALYNYRNNLGLLDNKLHNKQASIGAAIGDIRNMAGHSLEARTMERWDLTSHSAKVYIELTLSTIKSIHEYVQNSYYIF